jgi:hypothetical protein
MTTVLVVDPVEPARLLATIERLLGAIPIASLPR